MKNLFFLILFSISYWNGTTNVHPSTPEKLKTATNTTAPVQEQWTNPSILNPPKVLTPGPALDSDFKIMTHNVYLINPPLGISAAPYRIERATEIAKADYIKGHDLLILNELFDNDAANIIQAGLINAYPYQTKIGGISREGWDRTIGLGNPADGNNILLNMGVAVLSKWPIEERIQVTYNKAIELCGWDAYSNKGFVYVRINYKNNQKIHIIATHTQAEDSGCGGEKPGFTLGSEERSREFKKIRSFLLEKKIPKNEAVFIGGDLNVVNGTAEYNQMLSDLNAAPVKTPEHEASYDPSRNKLIKDKKLKPELLDYILVSKDFAPVEGWNNRVIQPLHSNNTIPADYSDHFPVVGAIKPLGPKCNCPPQTFRAVSDHSWVEFRLPALVEGTVINIGAGAYQEYYFPKCNRVWWSDLTFKCRDDCSQWDRVNGSWDADAYCTSYNYTQPFIAVGYK